MDIELRLREQLVLRDPGVRFTDDVMSRLGNAPVVPRDGVTSLDDARARKRSRRILFATVVVVGAAAAMPAWMMLRDRAEPPVVDAALLPATDVTTAESSPGIQMQVQSVESDKSVNPLDCLDPDVIRGILLMGVASQTFSIDSGLPPELAAFKAPRQLTWVGSTQRTMSDSQSSQSLVYRTSLAPDAARAVGVKALMAGGWQLHSDNRMFGNSVFTTGNSSPGNETYCREGKPVGIAANALDGVTYVILSMSRNEDRPAGFGNACDQPSQPFARMETALDKYMPTLELPRDPATGQHVLMRGSSGGGTGNNTKRSTSVSFMTQDSIGNVAQHFARQMTEQGWNADASWNGAAAAGSTWTRLADAGTTLQGTLLVSTFDESRFTTVFNIIRIQ